MSGRPARRGCPGNVWKSFAYGFLMDCSFTAPIWVLYLREERGLSLAQITLLEVPLFLLIVFAEIPTGAVADRFGRKVSLMLASAVLTISMLAYGLATSYVVILVSNLAWGLAFTLRSGADGALLYDTLQELGREAEFQRVNGRFWALRALATLGGFLLGAPIAAATSYSGAILLSALVAAAALPIALSMHEPRRAPDQTREPYLRMLAEGVRDAWRTPSLRYVFLYSGVVGAGAAAPLLLYQQPWLAAHGVGTTHLGLWQASAHGAEVLAALAASGLLARLGARGAFPALPLILFLCVGALGMIEQAWIAVAFLGVAFARGLHNPILADYVNRRIASSRRATVLSVQSAVGNVIMAITWPLGGMVADAWGLRMVFLAYASGTIVLAGAALVLWDRAERAQTGGLLKPP